MFSQKMSSLLWKEVFSQILGPVLIAAMKISRGFQLAQFAEDRLLVNQ